jgi:hypothetical protein
VIGRQFFKNCVGLTGMRRCFEKYEIF